MVFIYLAMHDIKQYNFDYLVMQGKKSKATQNFEYWVEEYLSKIVAFCIKMLERIFEKQDILKIYAIIYFG